MTIRECAIVMAHTGICMLAGENIDVFYKYLAELFGRPVYTHEIAFMENEIKERSKPDFIKLCKEAEPERKTGRWIKRTRIYESGTCTSYEPEWLCSECRTKYDPYFAFNRVKFCYVCGSDMRGGQSDT